MRKLGVILILIMLLFCIGCRRHCYRFPANLNYFPYSKNQKLKFVNSLQNIQTFNIYDKENSKSYFSEMYSKGFCKAYSNCSINSTQNVFNIRCSIQIVECVEVILMCDVQNTMHSDYFAMPLLQGSNTICNYDEITTHLADTISIENESNTIIRKIVIIKGKGLVSYTTADGEEWELIE